MTETAGIQNIYYTSQKHTQSQSLNNTPFKWCGRKAADVYIANSIQNIYYTQQKRTQSQNNTPYNTFINTIPTISSYQALNITFNSLNISPDKLYGNQSIKLYIYYYNNTT
eukprot:141787_1